MLDLHLLNGLQLSEDRETAYVGTGNRWGAVYEWLEPSNRTVVGGRVGDVGVGGFLLGGIHCSISNSLSLNHSWNPKIDVGGNRRYLIYIPSLRMGM